MLITILNIPIFRFYYNARQDNDTGTNDIYSDFSLGNVGSSHVTCGTSRYAGVIYGYNMGIEEYFESNNTISLECRGGAKLGEILQLGLSST